jgi:hypothetical protein
MRGEMRLRGWVVVYAPVCDHGDEDTKYTLEDENPRPRGLSAYAVLV